MGTWVRGRPAAGCNATTTATYNVDCSTPFDILIVDAPTSGNVFSHSRGVGSLSSLCNLGTPTNTAVCPTSSILGG
jgi:hypothetical protein